MMMQQNFLTIGRKSGWIRTNPLLSTMKAYPPTPSCYQIKQGEGENQYHEQNLVFNRSSQNLSVNSPKMVASIS